MKRVTEAAMATTTEPPPLDDTNLLDDEPGPTPTITPTSPSPPPVGEDQLILSDDPVTDDLESPFDDPADLMTPVALIDGPEYEPISLGSDEPSTALPENRGLPIVFLLLKLESSVLFEK